MPGKNGVLDLGYLGGSMFRILGGPDESVSGVGHWSSGSENFSLIKSSISTSSSIPTSWYFGDSFKGDCGGRFGSEVVSGDSTFLVL